MKLIICEKPSLAKNVAKAIGKFELKNGYFQTERYYITYAFGHLFSLFDIEDYTQSKNKFWDLKELPFYPEEFKFKLKTDFKTKKTDEGVKKQFNIIKDLIGKSESIIHCGDSDREGEIIIRIILSQAGNTKKVYRLWLPEQTEETILSELKNLKEDENYNNLANEGLARTFIDWVYGINLTRYVTLKSGTLLNIGRVIVPIIKAIHDRDQAIKDFKISKYFIAVSESNNIILNSKEKFDTKELCEAYIKKLGNTAIVKSIENKEKIIPSPKLFSQSTLQNTLSKFYDFAPAETLKNVQELYEKGFVTYPRTATEFLAENEKDKIQSIINSLQDERIKFKDSKRIFDNTKIESHSAITITSKAPDLNALNKNQALTYETIKNRFLSVFCAEDYKINETIIKINCNDVEEFTLKGFFVITKGWTSLQTEDKKEKELPSLKENQEIHVTFEAKEKETNPPKHYTVETLNNFLKNPFKKEDDTEDEEYKNLLKGLEIGTEATRSGIIEKAIKQNYIELKKKNYLILEKGILLIKNLEKLNIDMSTEKTVFLNSLLKKIYKNEMDIQKALLICKEEITNNINQNTEIEKFVPQKESFGQCFRCNKNIIKNKKAYTCEDINCNFTIWIDKNFLTNAKKKLTDSIVKKLLDKKEPKIKGLISAKTGKIYDCAITLEDTGTWVNIKPIFNNK